MKADPGWSRTKPIKSRIERELSKPLNSFRKIKPVESRRSGEELPEKIDEAERLFKELIEARPDYSHIPHIYIGIIKGEQPGRFLDSELAKALIAVLQRKRAK